MAETIAAGVGIFREGRGWSQRQLSEELARVGHPIDRSVISRIEAGDRTVSAVEVLALAAALAVPPVLLLVPLGDDVDLAVVGDTTMWPWVAYEWIVGLEPFSSSGPDGAPAYALHGRGFWRQASEPVLRFQQLRRLTDEVTRWGHAKAESPDSDDARQRFDIALRELVQHRRYMRETRIELAPMTGAWKTRADELGITEMPATTGEDLR